MSHVIMPAQAVVRLGAYGSSFRFFLGRLFLLCLFQLAKGFRCFGFCS